MSVVKKQITIWNEEDTICSFMKSFDEGYIFTNWWNDQMTRLINREAIVIMDDNYTMHVIYTMDHKHLHIKAMPTT